jgi:two-component system chemotaxis response regulator CheY
MTSIIRASRALVLDDDQTFAKTTAFLLRRSGLRYVTIEHDFAGTWERLQPERFDVILSDWNMEPEDGYTFLKRVRAEPAFRFLPFIMMTGNPSLGYEDMAIKAGASAFLRKPFTLAQLEGAIDGAMGGEIRTSLPVLS